MDNDNRFSRRNFLGIATGAIGGLISAIIGIPAVGYILGPALRQEEETEWIQLGSTTKVETGTPTLFKTKIERQTGWIVDERELSVYVRTDDGREFVALSNVCTHLGCRVRWIADDREFFCPCHNAAFNADGTVKDGPPPRPLDKYEVKVEDDQIYIRGV